LIIRGFLNVAGLGHAYVYTSRFLKMKISTLWA